MDFISGLTGALCGFCFGALYMEVTAVKRLQTRIDELEKIILNAPSKDTIKFWLDRIDRLEAQLKEEKAKR